MKPLFMVGALTLASFGIASAKSYDITLGSPAQLGATQLKAGEYKVKVEGSQVTLTDLKDMKTYTAPVRIEHAGQKFGQTSVQTRNQNGVDQVFEITLGGSDTKLELGE
jgi:hypothetical protein